MVRDQLIYKFGSEFGQIAAMGSAGHAVNARLLAKLVYQAPEEGDRHPTGREQGGEGKVRQ